VEPLQGREFLEGKREGAEVTTRIRIRHRDGVMPSMRVVWGSHTYDILAVIEVKGQEREMHLMCRELITG
jgi:SPP1 family predicted phage head-tail adaptor